MSNINTKKDMLLAEVLGDTGKILDNCEAIANAIPKITEKHTDAMSSILNNWQKTAKEEHTKILESSLPKIKNEIRDLITLEISQIANKAFNNQKDNIELVITKKLDKHIYFAVIACLLCLFIGLFIGKFFLAH
jgi:hypothetical protein